MKNRIFVTAALVLTLMCASVSVSYAAGKEGFGTKVKKFWRNLIGYPARVTEESASVVADTAKKGVGVLTTEIKRVGDVTSGDVAKTKELVTEPITGAAETAVKAVEGAVKVPSEAMKEKSEETRTVQNQ